MSEAETILLQRLDALTTAVFQLAQSHGARLNKSKLAARLGVHRNTLSTYQERKDFPKAGPDGKWALADIIAWEQGRRH